MSIEACETHLILSGISSRRNSLAASWLERKLSSTKKMTLPVLALDLGEHLAGPPHKMAAVEEHADGAEVACEAATARELHQRDGKVALAP